jgi:hypothetical protein
VAFAGPNQKRREESAMRSRILAAPGPFLIFLAALFVALAFPAMAQAQYMYLDSNGDGVSTMADQVNPTGTTVADLYLRTDRNRDGSAAVCATGRPLTVNSYVAILRATDGTIAWGPFVNRQGTMAYRFGHGSSSTEIGDGYGGVTPLAPGLHRLASISFEVASGSPAIQIVGWALTLNIYDMTSFGSQCDGLDLDNTLKLGSDWFDVDGLVFGSAPPENRAPVLAPIADMTVRAGGVASQVVSASDPDAQFLKLTRVSGPPYMSLLVTVDERGSTQGLVRLAPAPGDEGTAQGLISVTDGEIALEQSFQIYVGPPAPGDLAFRPIPPILMPPGTVRREPLYARDSDGQAITFRKTSGPEFVQVTTLARGTAAATGEVRLTPALCDVGFWLIEVVAQSGGDAVTQTFLVEVRPSEASAPGADYLVGRSPLHVHLADVNRDRHLDAITTASFENTVMVRLGLGDGSFREGYIYTVGREPWHVASGDWNQDGHPDLAVANAGSDDLSILMNRGNGTFEAAVSLTVGARPNAVATGDLNSDGRDDLVIANGGVNFISVFLGAGGGAFGSRIDAINDRASYGVTIGDFNLDGRLDVVSSNWVAQTFSFFPGFGDGTFGARSDVAAGGSAFSSAASDLNGDGLLDLCVANYSGPVAVFVGIGNGAFRPPALLETRFSPQYLRLGDFDGDGRTDLAVAGEAAQGIHYYQGLPGGTFGSSRIFFGPSFGLDAGDLDENGILDLVGIGSGPSTLLRTYLNPVAAGRAPEARSFVQGEHRTFGSSQSAAALQVRLEPVMTSYRNEDVDRTSISLFSDGTGSVQRIFAVTGKTDVAGDLDHNGIEEIGIRFTAADLARLFDQTSGQRTVIGRLDGVLVGGRPFCAPISVPLAAARRALEASVTPNPLNPEGVLEFRTARQGFLRVKLFDLQGRLVRSLLDESSVVEGVQRIRIDGRTAQGAPLASGVYFYLIDAEEGRTRGRFTVLK